MFSLSKKKKAFGLFTLTLLFLQPGATLFSAAQALAWEKALAPYSFSFPRDHGSHPRFKTEWWYLTGQLRSPEGREFGYQFTIFRHGINETTFEKKGHTNPWQVRDLFILHCALSDIESRSFLSHQDISRAGPGLAGARENHLDTWLKGSRLTLNEKKGLMELTVQTPEYKLKLELKPSYPPILNGNKGLSAKGKEPGQASYYYSWPQLKTEGSLKLSGENFTVKGLSWLDREFATNQLGPEQAGWDWFAIHLDDGSALMLYRMRLKDGDQDPSSSGTWIFADGGSLHLNNLDFKLSPGKTWEIPKSGANYPVNWEITVKKPSAITLNVAPLIFDQEMNTENTALANYWEGAIKVKGFTDTKREIKGRGYLEMTGYDQALEALQKGASEGHQ